MRTYGWVGGMGRGGMGGGGSVKTGGGGLEGRDVYRR